MKEFMKWLGAEKIDEQENGVYVTLKNNNVETMNVLIEDYDAKKISDFKLLMSKNEFEILKEVYEDSLISWR